MSNHQHKVIYTLWCAAIFLIAACTSQTYPKSSVSGPLPTGQKVEAGKCYGKAMMPDEVQIEQTLIPTYTGTNFSDKIPIDTLYIKVKEAASSWEKRKADKNCIAKDPEGCMVWCLIEHPAEYDTICHLLDTFVTKDFTMTEITITTKVKEGGYMDWVEVLCKSQVNPQLIKRIQAALRMYGFYNGDLDGKMSKDLKAALVQYQQNNYIPIGNINVATLKHLGVM